MVALAEKRSPVKKYTGWQKCVICQYGNNFEIEVKKDNEDNYFYGEKCPRCNHYEEFREISKREASKFLLVDDL